MLQRFEKMTLKKIEKRNFTLWHPPASYSKDTWTTLSQNLEVSSKASSCSLKAFFGSKQLLQCALSALLRVIESPGN